MIKSEEILKITVDDSAKQDVREFFKEEIVKAKHEAVKEVLDLIKEGGQIDDIFVNSDGQTLDIYYYLKKKLLEEK